MSPFRHILVGTDFGEASTSAVDLAIDIASRYDSRLTVLHTTWLPTSTYASYEGDKYWPAGDVAKEDQAAYDMELQRVRARYPKAVGSIVTGEAWEMLLSTARDIGADLIVLGTHGRRGVSRVLLGSVAEKVVRLSPVPVLTVSGKADRDAKEKAQSNDATALPLRPRA